MLYASPVGLLVLSACDAGLTLSDWASRRSAPEDEKESPLLLKARAELREYFALARTSFSIPLAPTGTPFQRAVWRALEQIPYGHTTTYKAIAKSLGCPQKVRAVAHAIGQNPLSLFVPCHRVVGSDGKLHGYAGGLEAKRFLLDMEARGIKGEG